MSARHPVPADALDKHIAILGKTESGKSNLAKTLAEDLLACGTRVRVIDPTGTWWGQAPSTTRAAACGPWASSTTPRPAWSWRGRSCSLVRMARGDPGLRAMCVPLLASVGGSAIVFLLWSAFVIDVAGQLTRHP